MDVSARTQTLIFYINSPRQLSQLREMPSVIAGQRKPPRRAAVSASVREALRRRRARGGRPIGRQVPGAPLRALTQGPGAALFDGFVLAPGRFLLQLPQDLFHLDLRRDPAASSEKSAREARQGDAAAWPWAPRRPLRSPRSGPRAAADESRRLHAAATSVPPPRPSRRPARPGQVRSARATAAGGRDSGPGAAAGPGARAERWRRMS